MKVTLKQLAEVAGVSIGTVSRALNNDPLIAAGTRKRIAELAGKMNYIPSNLGRALQSNRSKMIGCLISNVNDSFYSETLQGLGKSANDKGYGLLVGVTESETTSETAQLRFFQEKCVDGIIISNHKPETAEYILRIFKAGVPVVFCDFESFDENIPTVILDDIKATSLLVEHVALLGHKRVAFAYQINDNSVKRFEAGVRFATDFGIQKTWTCKKPEEVQRLLTLENRPTAIICYSDFQAVEIKHLAESMGFSIPGDISITGFDDMNFASWPEFDLTTIYQPKVEMGVYALDMLIDMIENKAYPIDKIIEPKLISRKSTAPIKPVRANEI